MIRAALCAILLLAASSASAECAVQAFDFNPNEAGVYYISLIDGTTGTTESGDNHFTPSVDMVAASLRVVVNVAPGGAANDDEWTVTVRDDLADSTLGCVITGLETDCQDSVSTPTIATDSEVTLKVDATTGTSAPDAAARMWVTFCWSAAP